MRQPQRARGRTSLADGGTALHVFVPTKVYALVLLVDPTRRRDVMSLNTPGPFDEQRSDEATAAQNGFSNRLCRRLRRRP